MQPYWVETIEINRRYNAAIFVLIVKKIANLAEFNRKLVEKDRPGLNIGLGIDTGRV
jgi:hypothetical protein